MRIALFIGLALSGSLNVAEHYTCHMYNAYNPQPVCWSLSLCYTTLYHLSHQHHPHHDNKDLHAVDQSHPSEITVAQMASVTTTTPLLTTALPLLCSPDGSVSIVARMRDGRATGIEYSPDRLS